MPGPPPEPGRFSRTFKAFQYRDFRLLWLGAFTSTTGTWMQTVAQSWLVLSLTGSPFYLGVDAFLATLPIILFSLVGGVIADRIERRKILLVSQYMQMSFAFILSALIYYERVEVWHIFVLSFCTGTAQSFGGPAYQALLPLLVPREHVTNAITLNSMQFNLARMLGPVLAGIAFGSVGAAFCFLLNGLSFIPVILSLMALHISVVPSKENRDGIFADMKQGFVFMKEKAQLYELTLLAFVCTFFGIPLLTLMPVVAKSTFGLNAEGYGWLMAVSGAGSVSGALFLAGSRRKRAARTALRLQLVFAMFLTVFAFSRVLPLSMVALFFASGCLLGVIATYSSLIQLATSEEMRGRVMSIFMFGFRGGMPLGNLTAGWVAERFSVTLALGMNAGALAAVAIAFLVTRTRLRELDT